MTGNAARAHWIGRIGAGLVLALVVAGVAPAAEPAEPAKETRRAETPLDDLQPPEVLAKSQRPPLYPAAARAARVSGAVVVEAVIDPEGKVREARAIVTTHEKLGFEEAAVDAVMRWKFRPALYRGEPVEYTTRFRLFFGRNAAALYGAQMSLAMMREAPSTAEAAVRPPTYKASDGSGKGTIPARGRQ